MLNYSQEAIDELVDIIYKKIKEKFEKELNEANVEFSRDGVVKSINEDGSIASVDIGDNVLENIPNKTGQVLTTDDINKGKVRIYYDRHTMKNAYIGMKY